MLLMAKTAESAKTSSAEAKFGMRLTSSKVRYLSSHAHDELLTLCSSTLKDLTVSVFVFSLQTMWSIGCLFLFCCYPWCIDYHVET